MDAPGLPGTILRLPFVYGPGDGLHRLAEYLRPMDEGLPTILMDERRAGWRAARGYIGNVAEAIALAATHSQAAGRVYNVADAEAFTEREWALSIGRAAGWTGEVVAKPREQLPADMVKEYDFSQHLFADTRRIRTELGYRFEWERRPQS
ncbi:MAG: NAD-dependent epimerase/dehydratase family protein [Bacillota bacterium]